jgi:hypothetical protein
LLGAVRSGGSAVRCGAEGVPQHLVQLLLEHRGGARHARARARAVVRVPAHPERAQTRASAAVPSVEGKATPVLSSALVTRHRAGAVAAGDDSRSAESPVSAQSRAVLLRPRAPVHGPTAHEAII